MYVLVIDSVNGTWCDIYLSIYTDHNILCRPSALFRMLSLPDLTIKPPTFKPKSSARVLTSIENIRVITEKECLKKEIQELKEQRKKARELKQLMKKQSMCT